jgi:ABC-2 type transport system permease protein
MAVAVTMARMKVAILRHSMTGRRGGMVATAGTLGMVLAAGTIYLATLDGDWLAAAYAVWMLGWIIGPVFSGGGDETLRPEYFAPLGLPLHRLAAGLLVSAFVGVAPAISLLALSGLSVLGVRQGGLAALVALPAMVLQLAVFVLLSKVAVAALGIALRSRVGAIGAGLINGAVLAFLGQGWVFAMAFGQGGQIPPLVRYLPSGWGVLAVQGDYAALAAMVVLIALLLGAWAALLSRRAGASRPSALGRRPMRAASAREAVLAKELRTWTRDLVRTHQLTFALAYGVFFAAAPLVLGWTGMLPWAGPIFIVMAASMTSNLYGLDGTAHWLTLMTPGASDVRGRQLAWLVTVAPVAVLLAVTFTAVNGGPWPMIIAVTAALLGGGAGMVPLISVYALVPGIDPQRRGGNPLRTSEDDGALTGLAYLMMVLVAATAVPAGVVAALFGWPGVAVGVLTGALCFWGLGVRTERRLAARGPELLDMMRTGRRPVSSSMAFKLPEMPKTARIVTMTCWTLGAIPLFPQGILAAVFLVNGQLEHSWFLATYMSPGLRWPTAIFMIVLGLAMYGAGLWIPARYKKAS